MGYDVYLPQDGSSSRKEFEHNAGLDRIKSNGAKITTIETILFEWLKSSKHIHFKEVQNFIK